MDRQIDPRWEYDCYQVDFHSPLDPDADDWFDVDRENEPPMHHRNNRTALGQLKHAIPSIKSPLKELNVELSSRSSKPATCSSRNSIGSHQFRKKSPEITRHFHFKTKMTAGRRTEMKRKSVDSSHYLSTISVCSKTSQGSRATENEEKKKDFAESLRKYDTPDQTKRPASRCTIPVPFSFEFRTVEKKTPVSEFKSFAQQVISYQNKTPLRFRTKPKVERVNSLNSSVESRQSLKKACVPRSPSLQTKNRTRPAVQSREEIEEEEYQKMKNYKFQAQAFKDEIYRKGYQDLPEKRVKNSTVIKSFALHVNVPRKAPRRESFKFHAKPINKEIFERVLGIPKVPKANAVPVEPFSFAELDRERQRKREQKIQEAWEDRKRQREFRANPLPDLGVVKGVPEKQPKPKTVIKPFDFLKNDRELHNLEKKRIAEEMQRLNEPVVFKAKPMASGSPFVPQKPNRYLTCDAAPNLHSDKRAEERRAFERHLLEKEERRKQEEEERRRWMENLEEEEQKRIRNSAVHKAQPIRQYPAPTRPPSKELTEPVTPKCLRKNIK